MPPFSVRSPRRGSRFTLQLGRSARTLASGATALAIAACSDGSTAPVTPPKTVIDPSVLQVGDRVSLNANTTSACDRVASGIRVGRVAAVGTHAVIVADTSNPAGGFTDADYQSFAASFDTLVYNVDVRHFGAPADAVSGGRSLVFYTSAVNALTPAGADYYIGGFFWVRDLFPTSGTNACAGSNASEMFYMLVPDPSGTINGNAHLKADVARSTVGVLGHEFQHLINASRRLYVQNSDNYLEELWLNEGLSHIAEELDFYRSAGFSPAGEPGQSPRARLTPSAIENQSAGLAALNGYELQNIARLGLYLQGTEQYGPYVPQTGSSGATTTYDFLQMRGAIWSFLRYAADRSGKTDSAFFQPIVNSSQTGLANLQSSTGLGASLTDWLRDWAVSNYADGAVPALDARYRQASWNFRSILTGFTLQGGGLLNGGVYPLKTRALADAQAQTFPLRGGTAAYLEFTVPAGAQATLHTQAGTAATLPNVVRVSVVAPGAATADAAVVNYDAGTGGMVTVANAGTAVARYALVVFDADPDYNATQTVTVTGTGLAAAPAPLVAPATLAAVAGPTRARLAVAAEPLETDAPVLARLHAIAARELTWRVPAAREALRVQRLSGPPRLK